MKEWWWTSGGDVPRFMLRHFCNLSQFCFALSLYGLYRCQFGELPRALPTQYTDYSEGWKVSSVNGAYASDSVTEVAAVGSDVYFIARDTEYRVWKFNNPGQSKLPETNPSGEDAAHLLTPALGALYFVSNNAVGAKLYRWSGTTLDQVTNTNTTGSDGVDNLVVQGGVVYFTAKNSVGQQRLYSHDGNTLRTLPLMVNPVANDSPVNMATIGGSEYFSAYVNSAGRAKAFSFDGKTLSQLPETFAAGSDDALMFTGYADDIYYVANATSVSRKVYRLHNGSVSMPFQINTAGSDQPASLLVHQGALYFIASAADGSRKVYRWNGSAVTQISNTNPGGTDYPQGLVSVGADLLFTSVANSSYQSKLFRYDGTTVSQISNVNPSGSDNMPIAPLVAGNKAYCAIYDSSYSSKLYSWSASEGLVQISNINPGSTDQIGGPYGNPLVVSAGDLYFVAGSNDKLYRLQGTSVTAVTNLTTGTPELLTRCFLSRVRFFLHRVLPQKSTVTMAQIYRWCLNWVER